MCFTSIIYFYFLILYFCSFAKTDNLVIKSVHNFNLLKLNSRESTKRNPSDGNSNRVWVGSNGTIYSTDAVISAIVGDTNGIGFYFVEASLVKKYNASSNSVTILSGNSSVGFSGDNGPANSAQLNNPQGLWITTSGVLYIADTGNNRIRRISENIITTIAGSSNIGGFSVDNGPATLATLHTPTNIYVDSTGRVYIADYGNHVVRYINDNNGSIFTLTGSTTSRIYNGERVPAMLATLDPMYVTGDTLGNIYIADHINNRIRMIDSITGNITTFLGNELSPGSINRPNQLWFDSSQSSLYYNEDGSSSNSKTVIRKASVVKKTGGSHHVEISLTANDYPNLFMTNMAGTGTAGNGGSGGAPTSTQIAVRGIWANTNGVLYLMDYDYFLIRRISTNAGIVTINNYGGTGSTGTDGVGGAISSTNFKNPWGIVGDSANQFLYLTDQFYVWKVALVDNTASVFCVSVLLAVLDLIHCLIYHLFLFFCFRGGLPLDFLVTVVPRVQQE
jgi:hypothetical protein